jgi:hypothetical protein
MVNRGLDTVFLFFSVPSWVPKTKDRETTHDNRFSFNSWSLPKSELSIVGDGFQHIRSAVGLSTVFDRESSEFVQFVPELITPNNRLLAFSPGH